MKSLHIYIPREFFLIAALFVGLFVTLVTFIASWKIVAMMAGACVFAGVLVAMPAEKLIVFYFAYLMFEGAIKIWTNYNPVAQVGSDLVLIFALFRMLHANAMRTEQIPIDKQTKARLNAVTNALIVFWFWVAIQFFNPWGLGLLPSLASLKVYAVPTFAFLGVGYCLKDDDIKNLIKVLCVLAFAEALFTTLDWSLGEKVLPSLHWRYAEITARFGGLPYRPFGTMAIAGAPSVWMFHSLTAFLFLLSNRKKSGEQDRSKRGFSGKAWNIALSIYPSLTVFVLLVCQVRVIMIRFFLVGFLGLMVLGRRYLAASILCLFIPALIFFGRGTMSSTTVAQNLLAPDSALTRTLARASTLEDPETYLKARGGGIAMVEILNRAKTTLAGIGLSRTGAASIPWQDLMKNEPFFSDAWAFTENLYLSVFTELGLGGLVAYVLLMGVLLWQLFSARSETAAIALINCVVILLSGYASEGLLYQPDASFFWLNAAIGLRAVSEKRGVA